MKPTIWSNGGGTQSMALAVAFERGMLPPPDLAIMADTSREGSATWAYYTAHMAPLLARLGVETVIAPHTLATVDLYSGNGDMLLPAFTPDGGKLKTLCSTEWKRRVVMRALRSLGFGPDNPVQMILGMSRDEIHRMKTSPDKWIEHVYPLAITLRMSRYDCLKLVIDAGYPAPPKSACWMCPHHSNEEWRDIRDNWPQDWQRAKDIQQQIAASHGVNLHRAGLLTEEIIEEPDTDQLELTCETGYCMT